MPSPSQSLNCENEARRVLQRESAFAGFGFIVVGQFHPATSDDLSSGNESFSFVI